MKLESTVWITIFNERSFRSFWIQIFNFYIINQLFKSHWLRFVISALNELIIGLITYFMTVLMCELSSRVLSIFGWNERDCDRSA